MRAVNLIPEELRPRVPGEGDPRVAYGVVGGLGLLLLMIVVAISYTNKLHTIEDQTAAINAQIATHTSGAASITVTPDTVGKEVASRTLLVGGLAASRFPWPSAIYNLSRSLPKDVTLDTIAATSPAGGADTSGGTPATAGATMQLSGCTSGWQGYARLMTWLRTMPGVDDVKSSQSSVGTPEQPPNGFRTKNCGPAPLTFTLNVIYVERPIDLLGLPRPTEGASGSTGASGATGAAPAATPAAAPTPAPPAATATPVGGG